MNQIAKYFFTVFGVFLFLTSIFMIFMLIKFIINARKYDYRKKSGFRGNENFTVINKSETNKEIAKDEIIASKELGTPINKNEKVIRFDNGDIYKGEILNGKRSGFGICLFSNKDKYEGLWKNDLMHCVGKYIFSDGSIYTGDFKDGLIEGLGMHRYVNKDIYKGYYKNNKREGKGVLYYKDGSKYTGSWNEDKQSGEGELIKSNGEHYKGQFLDGKFNGRGEYIYSDGSKYIGEYKNNVFHGHGCFIKINGDIYEGEYKYGCKRGYGILKTRSNGTYEGEFKDDLFEGTGRYTYNDKSIYEGDFKKGKKEGIGTFICKSYKYIGEWKENNKGEIGTYYLDNKAIIDVIIKDNIIVEGVYKHNGEDDRYIYNIDLKDLNEENVMDNIECYFKRKNKNHYNESQFI